MSQIMNIEQGISNVEMKDIKPFLPSKFIIPCSIFIILFLFSCKKEQNQPVYLGYDYFPANVGHYVIYQCDSVYFNPYSSNKPQFDTSIYQIKEVIDSIYNDNQGRPTMRIVRYKRNNDSISWNNISLPEKVWSGNLLSTTAQRLEDNYRYVKLIFPVSLNATWNGNVYNTLGEWDYKYTSVNTPLTLGSAHFDSTLTVAQQNYSTLLQYQYYEEQYATGIGLIYKEVIDYTCQNLQFSAPPPIDSANSGTIFYSETYLSSGN
jgi:hypothetical protein